MNAHFHFRQFTIYQDRCAQKVSEVACVFGAWIPIPAEAVRVLDIGGGTGLLSLMLAQRFPACHLHSIEVDQDAFEQMQENFKASPFASRLQAVFGDIRRFESLAAYDAIVVNPPFFEKQLKSPDAQKNRAWHSELLTLPELLHSITRLLTPDGTAFILWPATREQELLQALPEHRLHLQRITRLAHSPAHAVKHLQLQVGKTPAALQEETLYLREGADYSPEIEALLREYYLKLG